MKHLLIFLIVAVMFGLTACSPSSSSKNNDEARAPFNPKPKPDGSENTCLDESDMDADGIVGGQRVPMNSPWASRVVGLLMITSEGASICTGTPIKNNIILTAGHCLDGVSHAQQILVIRYHSFTCQSGFSIDTMKILVKNFKIHEAYNVTSTNMKNKNVLMNDIALVQLAESLPSNYIVSELVSDAEPFSSSTTYFAGYGVTNFERNNSGILRLVSKDLSKVDVKQYQNTSRLIAVDQSDEQGVCSGDSGGALFVEQGLQFKVLGVNSFVGNESMPWGDSTRLCNGKVYLTNVLYYKDWIQKQLSSWGN